MSLKFSLLSFTQCHQAERKDVSEIKWCSEHEPSPGVDDQLWCDPREDRSIMPPADGPDGHSGTHGTERQSINH